MNINPRLQLQLDFLAATSAHSTALTITWSTTQCLRPPPTTPVDDPASKKSSNTPSHQVIKSSSHQVIKSPSHQVSKPSSDRVRCDFGRGYVAYLSTLLQESIFNTGNMSPSLSLWVCCSTLSHFSLANSRMQDKPGDK